MRLIDAALPKDVIEFFEREASFLDLEQHFTRSDPILIRTAAIAGLHAGDLLSSDLVTQLWMLNSRIQQQYSQPLTIRTMSRGTLTVRDRTMPIWLRVDPLAPTGPISRRRGF
ncbi:hypothetical protein PQR70_21450 [Paraburkholderia madseniana]|uniref:hypothetical protein n=1 Tax=Paraburkholderia madseniana TaxID=2599607 RepID=UPI0038BB6DB2